MSRLRLNSDSRGFTILELLIATVVFSVVLLLCAVAAVQVGRTFYKGVLINRVQDTTRRVTEDVSQSIQFGANSSGFYRTGGAAPGNQSHCFGETRYTYNTGLSMGTGAGQSRHILWKDRIGSSDPCVPVTLNSALTLGQELLGSNMRIPRFTVTDSPAAPGKVWSILLTVSYGETADLFTNTNFNQCIVQSVGGQFCAVSNIETYAEKRL